MCKTCWSILFTDLSVARNKNDVQTRQMSELEQMLRDFRDKETDQTEALKAKDSQVCLCLWLIYCNSATALYCCNAMYQCLFFVANLVLLIASFLLPIASLVLPIASLILLIACLILLIVCLYLSLVIFAKADEKYFHITFSMRKCVMMHPRGFPI